MMNENLCPKCDNFVDGCMNKTGKVKDWKLAQNFCPVCGYKFNPQVTVQENS